MAEAWEGVARAMGGASAEVKKQMLVLVQEAQSSRQDPTVSQADRRADLQRVSATISLFIFIFTYAHSNLYKEYLSLYCTSSV